MATNLKFCHVCYEKHVSSPSTTYCSECDQVFCSDCESSHSSIQSTRDHVTMPIKDYLSLDESFKGIRTNCPHHDEKYQMYCQIHDIPLCLSCLREHSACKEVNPLAKITQNLKVSEFVKDIEECLNDLEKNVSKIRAHLQKNVEILNTNKSAVLSNISQIRKKINIHLDKLEHCFREEIAKQEKKANKQLDSVLTSIDTKTSKVLSKKHQVTILKNHGNNLHTYLSLKQVNSELETSQKDINTMLDNGSFDGFSIKCEINDKLSRLISEIQTIGDVRIEKTPCDIKLDNNKERQAQYIITESKSFEDVDKKLIRSFKIKNKSIRGCAITGDSKILLTGFLKGCLACFDANRKHLFDISTEPNLAFDVTCIDNTTVAVTSGNTVISIVDISNQTVKKRIDVGYLCYGVTYRDGTLLTCARGHGILSVRLTDEKITTIVQCDLPPFCYITTHQDKLYYTNDKTKTVTCCDKEGNTIWTFNDKAVISCPRGITIDNEGRVYVCNSFNDAVILLSKDGKQSKTIISGDDGLCCPLAIHFDKKRHNIIVANSDTKVFLFHIKW